MAASFTGRLLVAHPEMRDPNFYRTVVLLFEHGEEGAFGTVLNRPTDELVVDHVPAWSDYIAEPPVVFVGGPVRNEVAVGVAEWTNPPDDWTSLFSAIGFIDLTDPPQPPSVPGGGRAPMSGRCRAGDRRRGMGARGRSCENTVRRAPCCG